MSKGHYVEIPTERLVVEGNPRKGKRKFKDLADSIRLVGLRQPLEVTPHGDEPPEKRVYVVMSGSRRLAALSSLEKKGAVVPGIDWEEGVPCIVRHEPEVDRPVIMLASNVYQDIPPSQKGAALKAIVTEEFWTIERAAPAVGETVARANVLLRLADAPKSIQAKVDSGEMSFSGFKRIAGSPVEAQEAIGEIEGKVTEEQAAKKVREVKGTEEQQDQVPVDDAPNILSTLREMRNNLSKIAQGPVGSKEQHLCGEIAEIAERISVREGVAL